MDEQSRPAPGGSQNKIADAWICRVDALEQIMRAIKVELAEIAARLTAVEQSKKAKN
jgi:hypothetical protein